MRHFGAFPAGTRANIAILPELGDLGIVAGSSSAKPLIFRNTAKYAKYAKPCMVEGAWQC
jgi:hypothetical protein